MENDRGMYLLVGTRDATNPKPLLATGPSPCRHSHFRFFFFKTTDNHVISFVIIYSFVATLTIFVTHPKLSKIAFSYGGARMTSPSQFLDFD